MPPVLSSPGECAVQRIDPLFTADWDAWVAGFPGGSFFHGSAWARVLRDTYGFDPVYWAASDPGHERALLPLMEVNSWLTGRRGVSLPFTDECAPLCTDPDSFRRLYRAALVQAAARGWAYLECRGSQPLFPGVPPSTSYWGHRLELSPDEPGLFAKLESSTRRAVRRAEHGGVTVEFSQDLAATEDFFRLFCRTRRHHGAPPQPFRFFERIHRHVFSQNLGWVVLARQGRQPIAGAVFFHAGKTANYKFGASDRRFLHLRANNLVMWQAIQWYARHGFTALDFGRTSLTNDGLRRFKLGWGARERRIDYFRYDRRKAGFVSVRDEAAGWYTRIFRLLPGVVSRLTGAALYRHIA